MSFCQRFSFIKLILKECHGWHTLERSSKPFQRPHTKANPIILRSQLVLWPKTLLADPYSNLIHWIWFQKLSPLSEVKFSFNRPEFAMDEGYFKIKNYKSGVLKLFWPMSMLLKWGHSNFLLFEIIFSAPGIWLTF